MHTSHICFETVGLCKRCCDVRRGLVPFFVQLLAQLGSPGVEYTTKEFLEYSRDHVPTLGRVGDRGHRDSRRMRHKRLPNGEYARFLVPAWSEGLLLSRIAYACHSHTTHS